MSLFPDYTPSQVFWHKSFYKLNYYYAKLFKPIYQFKRPSLSAQESSDLIYDSLVSDRPCMIARFGSTELFCLSNYLGIKEGWTNAIGFISGKREPWWWAPERVNNMRDHAGFFPINQESIEHFCELMLKDTLELDILASWLEKEKNLALELKDKPKVFLPYLEPWYAERPWSRVLESKSVVVVHPFADIISQQYKNNRSLLFRNSDVLPKFNLRTVKAIQSIGGQNDYGFESWFDALEWMKKEIDKEPYDIALIGCGAYGFPLAAHVKRSGHKAVHMGGALQLLFGIKGNRWEDPVYGVREWGLPENYYANMFNEYWIKPGDAVKPKNADMVEGACYW